jgi:hypothetical protein
MSMTIDEITETGVTEDFVKRCDELALSYLFIKRDKLDTLRQHLPALSSIYYKETDEDGGALIVCKDGSVLFAGAFVPYDRHITAFEGGLRTNQELLYQRRQTIWEV